MAFGLLKVEVEWPGEPVQEVSNVAMINLIRALCRSGALAAGFGLLLLAGCASAELPVYQDDPH